MKDIRIGTLVSDEYCLKIIPQIIEYGFESFGLTFWQTTGDIDLKELTKEVKYIVDDRDITISSISIFGNPLTGEGDNSDTVASWERLIDAAAYFNTDLVSGFTGRIPQMSINETIPMFKMVFSKLAKRAEERGVRIAFENCDMGGNSQNGDWNIAHNPIAWEMMFDAVPYSNVGLEWEPCHQMISLIDPIPQLRKWMNKIFHIHGKDATITWDVLKEFGKDGPKEYAWHRTPGFGDSNWSDIISILRMGGYRGCIDIEGGHDPVYKNDLEMTGQVFGLKYLKYCRGGEFVNNII